MRQAFLVRSQTGDAGTFGWLFTDSGFHCRTGELPWRDNLPNESCIPTGRYDCAWAPSTLHGECYHVQGVVGRSAVEIHAANWMGDKTKGLRCELLGCIAPGESVGMLDGQLAVISSQSALIALVADLAREPFELTIVS